MNELPSSQKIDWPSEGRLAGIDFGTVRVGVAVSDPSRRWVSPLDTYTRRSETLDRDYFSKIVRENSIVGLVIGLPIHCDGQESQKSLEARAFAKWLTEITHLPIRMVDERFSSAMANQLLAPADLSRKKNKQKIDRVAALVILESYLERERRGEFSLHQELTDQDLAALDDSI